MPLSVWFLRECRDSWPSRYPRARQRYLESSIVRWSRRPPVSPATFSYDASEERCSKRSCTAWCFCCAPRSSPRSARGALRQAILLIASYALYLTWGIWFAAVLLASTAMNFLVGRMASPPTVRARTAARHSSESRAARHFQVPAGSRGPSAFLFPAALLASGAAAWHLLLDLPGDELPVRSLPRRGTRPDVSSSSRSTWCSFRSPSPGRSAACPTCCRSSARKS